MNIQDNKKLIFIMKLHLTLINFKICYILKISEIQ